MTKGIIVKWIALVLVIASFTTLLCMDRILDGGKTGTGSDADLPVAGQVQFDGDETVYRRRNDVRTILFVGNKESSAYMTNDKGRNALTADFLTVLVIDDAAKTYSLMQIRATTAVEVVAGDAATQIESAHTYGVKYSKKTTYTTQNAVERLLGGVRMDGTVDVPLTAVVKLVDALGGIEIQPLENDYKIDSSLVSGQNVKISGELAYRYLTTMTPDEGHDEGGLAARRVVFMQAFYRAVRAQASSLGQLADLMMQIDHLNYYEMAITDLYEAFETISGYKYMGTFESTGTYEQVSGAYLFRANAAELQQYVRDTFCEQG